MNEHFPKPPAAKEMREDIYEREIARLRRHEDAIHTQLDLLDQERDTDQSVDQTEVRNILEQALRQLQELHKRAEALHEAGR